MSYPEYTKVSSFMSKAQKLLETPKRMEDVFKMSIIDNGHQRMAEFYNQNGRFTHYTYAKFNNIVYRYASVIHHLLADKKTGNLVILKVANSHTWVELFWSILMAGYKVLLINAKTKKEGTQNLINQSKAVAIITDDSHRYNVSKYLPIEITTQRIKEHFAPCWENEVIFCSSGTTGDVKLMVFNGENICYQVAACLGMYDTTKDIMYPRSMGKNKILCMIPFHHIFGFVAVFLWYTFFGKTLVFNQSNTPNEILNLCQKRGVTHIYSVPLFWDSLAQSVDRKKDMAPEDKQALLNKFIQYNLGRISKEEAGIAASNIAKNKIQKEILGTKVRYCISGGGYLSTKTLETINGLGYPLYNGYGMTELGVISVELSPNVKERLLASIGKPLHNVSYKIVPMGEDENQGELLVRSPITHIREIIGGVERKTQFDKEGYYNTGDIASCDNEGRYYIKGRIKDVIINADGENVFPDELEIFYKKLQHVNNVCVCGIKSSNGQNEDICLVLEVSNSVSTDELIELKKQILEVGKNLPKGTKINRIYLAKNKLPLAGNMKVRRFEVKQAIHKESPDYISIDAKKEQKKFDGLDKETVDRIIIPMREIFSEVLILPQFKIDDNANWINDLGGDSMNYVELIKKIENKYNVVIPESKYGELVSINDFVEEVAHLERK